MEIPEILLEFETRIDIQAALQAAVERREEITPELLRILEDTLARAAELSEDPDYLSHLYAMCLLAQFRETRAYPLMLRLGHLPGDILEKLLDDFLTEELDKVLASVCGGDLAGIQSLIEDEGVNEYVRAAALDSLVTLAATGLKSREEILEYFAGLFRGKLKREPSLAWDQLVVGCCALYPEELLPDIRQAFADNLIDPENIGLDSVDQAMTDGKQATLTALAANGNYRLLDDASAAMAWFDSGPGSDDPDDGEFDPDDLDDFAFDSDEVDPDDPDAPPTTFVRDGPKIGRNEPCPCGSGRKYKKCCGGSPS